jgi:hypothetical protein
MSDVNREDLVRFAADLERSAIGMMRHSKGALEDGDKTGAQREQTIAGREYEWAAGLWKILGQRGDAERCHDARDAILVGEWRDPGMV